jgi:hypothetical protein
VTCRATLDERKGMTKRLTLGQLLLSLCTLLCGPAKADLLGSTLSWQYYAHGGAYNFGTSSGTFVDNGGVGGTFSDGTYTYFNIVAGSDFITFDYSVLNKPIFDSWDPSPLSLSPTIHNGIAIDMVAGPAFTSVAIDPFTNMVGFDASRFSFTGSEIQVDWQGLPFNTGTIVRLDVTSVPEPSSLFLLAMGLTGIALWRAFLCSSVLGARS